MQYILGIIPITGKSYTVIHAPEGNITGYTEGYGGFPFNEYPNVPVIDLRNNIDATMMYLRYDGELPKRTGNVNPLLDYCYSNGIKVLVSCPNSYLIQSIRRLP